MCDILNGLPIDSIYVLLNKNIIIQIWPNLELYVLSSNWRTAFKCHQCFSYTVISIDNSFSWICPNSSWWAIQFCDSTSQLCIVLQWANAVIIVFEICSCLLLVCWDAYVANGIALFFWCYGAGSWTWTDVQGAESCTGLFQDWNAIVLIL